MLLLLRALWKIDVHLISTLGNKSHYYYYYYYYNIIITSSKCTCTVLVSMECETETDLIDIMCKLEDCMFTYI